ncbi:hypothetical protein SAMN04488061_0352 [Filomicrobium insigne]|uniref:Sel1 repeat-containing protein n=1 Tax=Filomicrobium insigne TaxID=418854 RepID=A0A1H0H1I5_9HYPH|nr:hypothetical protein [Filomicrobium insigne]SDO12960.1 hypothetical protein SAMN04488061_0352 [Filomicrobium insigne]
MNKPDKSSTDDLKRMLRRLERIEAEKAERAQTRTNASSRVRDLSSLPAGRRRAGLSDGEAVSDPAQIVQRATASSIAVAPEFPRPVPTPSEPAPADRQRVGAPVVAAAITAAIVSTLATVAVTMWLMGGLDRLPFDSKSTDMAASNTDGGDSAGPTSAPSAALEQTTPPEATTTPSKLPQDDGTTSQNVARFSGDARIAPEGEPSKSPEYVLTPSAPAPANEAIPESAASAPETKTESEPEVQAPSPEATEQTPPVANLQEPQPLQSAPALRASQPTAPSAPISPESLKLETPASVKAEPGVPLDFPVTVGADPSQLTGYYLVVSGLKRGTKFSHGIELLFDTWQIPARYLSGLKLTVPPGFARRMKLNVELRGPLGDTLTRSILTVELPGEARRAVGLEGSDDGDGSFAATDAQDLIDKAEVFLDNGSLQGARLLLERAAGHGSGSAAMLLGASYDPKYAGHFSSDAPNPNAAEAKRWYERAVELGVNTAQEHLNAISTTP